MSLFDRYGIKEVADVTFYELNEDNHNLPGKPVLFLDTLKVSTVEQTAESAEIRGGKGNAALMAWDYGKEITVNLEDALFSARSLELMYGTRARNANGGSVVRNKYFRIKDNTNPFFVYNSDTQKYHFNSEGAATFGLPWQNSGYLDITGSNKETIKLVSIGSKIETGNGIAAPHFKAATIVPTRIPKHLTEANYTYSRSGGIAPTAVGGSESWGSYGSGKITTKGYVSPYSNQVTLSEAELNGLDGVIGISAVVAFKGEQYTLSANLDSSGIWIVTLPVQNGIYATEFEATWTVSFNSGYYVYCYDGGLGDLGQGVITLDWSYAHKAGIGSLNWIEAGREIYGKSRIVVNDKVLSLYEGNTTKDIEDAGLEIDSGIYLNKDYYVFQVELDEEDSNNFQATKIDLSANAFPGVYYVTGDTFVRNEKTGKDEFFQVILPKVKVLSESNTITLEAEGDPTVFNMQLKVLKSGQTPMMQLVKYKPGNYSDASVTGAEFVIEMPAPPEGWTEENWEDWDGEYQSAWYRTGDIQLSESQVSSYTLGISKEIDTVLENRPEFSKSLSQIGINFVDPGFQATEFPVSQPSTIPAKGNPVVGIFTPLQASSSYIYSPPKIERTEEQKTHLLALTLKREWGGVVEEIITTFNSVEEILIYENPPQGRLFQAEIRMDGATDKDGSHVYYDIYVAKNNDGKPYLWGEIHFDVSWMIYTKQGRRWAIGRICNFITDVLGGRLFKLATAGAGTLAKLGCYLLFILGGTVLDGFLQDWLDDVFDSKYAAGLLN